jgi:hypothetical protein
MRAIRRPLSEGRSGRSHPLNCTIASRNLDFSDVYLRAINTKFRSIGVPCLLIFLSLAKNCEGQHDVAICCLPFLAVPHRSFLADGERNYSDWSKIYRPSVIGNALRANEKRRAAFQSNPHNEARPPTNTLADHTRNIFCWGFISFVQVNKS